MSQLIDVLSQLSKQFPLENYSWEIGDDCPIDIPDNLSLFEKNVYLKKHLSEPMANDHNLHIHYWIINKWGKIGSFKQSRTNDEKLKKLYKQLELGKLTKSVFDVISSLSKVASFQYPDKYAIYDSRAIYSLNWLMFKYTDKELFPQPMGRSKKLAQFDQATIFQLAQKPVTYHSHKTAYHCYCEQLRMLSEAVYGVPEPYMVEMLLFLIAPNFIVTDIQTSTHIQIDIKD